MNIIRDRKGEVTIVAPRADVEICYTLGKNKKVQQFTAPIPMRDGGTITAWFKSAPELKTVMTFDKIENIQVEVVNASSQESGGGEASHLVDGDPGSIWHTMYSVTVAKYPHWVDLDAGEVRTIKGFTYLPRQDSSNGNVKNYNIQVSMDGQNWSEPVAQGSFANDRKEKSVHFDKPVKARFVRFVALSEQSGQDYASGAELSILAE